MTRPSPALFLAVLLLSLPSAGPAQNLLLGPNDVVFDESRNRYLASSWSGNAVIALDAQGNQSVFKSPVPHAHGMEIRDSLLFVASDQRILVLHAETAALLDSFTVPGAQTLGHIALDDPAYVYASDWTARKIFRIDLAADTAGALVSLTDMPMGLWLEPENGRLVFLTYVNNAPVRAVSLPGGVMSTIRTTTINAADALCRDAAGRYYVSSLSGNAVHLFQPDWSGDPVVLANGLAGPSGLGYNARDGILGVTNYNAGIVSFLAIDALVGSTRARFTDPLLDHPEDIVYDSTRGCCYIACVDGDRIVRMDTSGVCSLALDSINSPMALALIGDTLLMTSNNPSTVTAMDLAGDSVLYRLPVPEALYLAQIEADPPNGVAYVVEQRGMILRVDYRIPTVTVLVPVGTGLVYGSQSSELEAGGGGLYVFSWPYGTIRRVDLADPSQITDAAPQVISQITASTSAHEGYAASSWLGHTVYRYPSGLTGAPVGISAGHVQPAGLIICEDIQALYVCNYGGNSIDRVSLLFPPPPPVLLSPADGATDVPVTATFCWRAVTGASTYRLQVSADSTFGAGVVIDDALLTDTCRTTVGFSPATRFFWRVRARNAWGEGEWSAARSFFTTGPITGIFHYVEGWNLISLPYAVENAAVAALFPAAVSPAFAFAQSAGYQRCDTLIGCTGYWLKFGGAQEVGITGIPRSADTIAVRQGWNLIGGTSSPVATGSILELPTGVIISAYSGYAGAYVPADTLFPGKAYWVKAAQIGRIVLR